MNNTISTSKAKFFLHCLSVLTIFIFLTSFTGGTVAHARENPGFVRKVRVIESYKTGLSHPVGLGFSKKANAFLAVEDLGLSNPSSEAVDVVSFSQFGQRSGSTRIMAMLKNPLNFAYDNQVGRLPFINASSMQLYEVRQGVDGSLNPETLVRHPVRIHQA